MTDFNILNSLGINSGIVVGIVALSELVKKIDIQRKLKRFYTIFPLLFSIGASFTQVKDITFTSILSQSMILFGASSFAYNFIKKSIGEPGTWKLTKVSDPRDTEDNR